MTSPAQATEYVPADGGRIAYDVQGSGPLVVLSPGMGDIRSSFRALAPRLAASGYRVATVDLRGHGDSDANFPRYGDEQTAADLLAVVAHLGGPAVLVGNSMSAGAAVIAAARRPELVSGLVLIGPFVRDPQMSVVNRLSMRLALARPWLVPVWKAYLPKLYAGQQPADFPAYRDAVVTSLRRPGRTAAFAATTRHTSHAPAEAALPSVHAPALVVMGALDPDFTDPEAEARWIGERLSGRVVMVPDAGHYPHAQRPDLVTEEVVRFLAEVTRRPD